MKNAVSKKLHSQAGASLLIALLFFLTALTVGAVVLTAAATNAGRIARNRQEQQDYLAVSSAAMLVKEDFRETVFTAGYNRIIKTTSTTVVDQDGNPHTTVTTTTDYNPLPATLTGGGALLTDRPVTDLETLYFSTVPVSSLHKDPPAEMKYDLEIAVNGLPDVFGSMEVDRADSGRYTVTVKLYAKAEDDTPANATTMLFAPIVNHTEITKVTSSEDTETATTTYTTTVSWGAPVITKEATT